MTRWLGIACAASLWIAPSGARAEEEGGEITRARFTSTASRAVIEAAACALPTLSSVDGNVQALDVRVGERRCSAESPLANSVELTLRISTTNDGAQSQVTIEAVAPEGVRVESARAIVLEARDDIVYRLEQATHAASMPAPVQKPTRVLERRAFGMLVRQNPNELGAGVAMLVLGGATLVGGLAVLIAGELTNCRSGGPGWDFGPDCAGDHTITTVGAIMMIGGGMSALLSIPLIVAGNKKVVDTTPRARVDVGLARVGLSVTF